MEEKVKNYLAHVLAYGIKLDFEESSEIDLFVEKLVEWFETELPECDSVGDVDGLLFHKGDCESPEDSLFASMTFINGHLKFHAFNHDLLGETGLLITKIVLATIGFCQLYFSELPDPGHPKPSHPILQRGGSPEEVISVHDDGFGIV